MGKDEQKNLYVIVHSGSRHLGKEITDYYLKEGQKSLKAKGITVPYELVYLQGELMQSYLHDLKLAQAYASLNRKIILSEICKNMKWKVSDAGECIHNYIDEKNILRKGAVSAYENENVIIPINMRDGIILAKGKGNPDWNYSAPHGAGRIANKQDIRNTHTLAQYKSEMKGIYSSTVCKETLSEAPFAYRGMNEIMNAISETVKIEHILKPVYNYKAKERNF